MSHPLIQTSLLLDIFLLIIQKQRSFFAFSPSLPRPSTLSLPHSLPLLLPLDVLVPPSRQTPISPLYARPPRQTHRHYHEQSRRKKEAGRERSGVVAEEEEEGRQASA